MGLLCGNTVDNNTNIVSHLIIPEQTGTSTGCETVDLDGEMDYSRVMERLDIKLIGLIHTHPGNTTSFLSSTDMHQLDLISRSDPSAVSFVYSPRYTTNPAFTLTEVGKQILNICPDKASNVLHQHPGIESEEMYKLADNIEFTNKKIRVLDLRSAPTRGRQGSRTRQQSKEILRQTSTRRTFNRD